MRKLARSAFVIALVATLSAARGGDASPPTQAPSGPGGADYPHASYKMTHAGEGEHEWWIYTPDEPRPESAPVVVLLHGWGGTSPSIYGGWIKHLARKGNIVIFPRYQKNMTTLPGDSFDNVIAALKEAFARVAEGPVKARSEGIVVVGHSMGGFLAANLATVSSEGIPKTRALLVVEPGNKPEKLPMVLPAFKYEFEHTDRVPQDLLAVCVAGDKDNVVGETGARTIYEGLARLPRANRDLLLVRSDDSTNPPLTADHFAPCSFEASVLGDDAKSGLGGGGLGGGSFGGGRLGGGGLGGGSGRFGGVGTNALDWYAWWKLADGLVDAVFRGKNKDYALGGGEHQLFMGKRSDGEPVKTIVSLDTQATKYR